MTETWFTQEHLGKSCAGYRLAEPGVNEECESSTDDNSGKAFGAEGTAPAELWK